MIGVPFEDGEYSNNKLSSPDILRGNLYQLSFNEKIQIADLGNLKPAKSKKGIYLALRDIVEYLLALDVIPVVIGGSQI